MNVELQLSVTALALGEAEAFSELSFAHRAVETDLARGRRAGEGNSTIFVLGACRNPGFSDGSAFVESHKWELTPVSNSAFAGGERR